MTNISMILQRAGRADPHRPAVYHGARLISSYGALARDAAGLARGLRERLGLKEGDRVALVMKNVPEYVTVMFGCWWGGLTVVPANAKLHTKEFDYILSDSGATVCFVTPDLAATVNAADVVAKGATRLIEIGSKEWHDLLRCEPYPGPLTFDADAMAWLFYTSGTTGRPKGAMLSHRNLLSMMSCYFMDVDQVGPGDSALHAAPMSHGSGMLMITHMCASAAQVIPESGGFDTDEIFELIKAHKGLGFFAAPTMVHRLNLAAEASDPDTSNLRTIVYGGGPMYVADCKRAMTILGNKLSQIYGQGESPMTITALSKARHIDNADGQLDARLASVGVAQTVVDLRVTDADGNTLPWGETGEVVVRGPQVMLGYWNKPEATAKTIRNGWLFTGDMGAMTPDGFLTLKDRSKDVIISGGTNIYPREVEEALLLHPAVREVSVTGKPHPDWGEDIVAFVSFREGATATPQELDAHCQEHIARFKRPKHYRFMQELPKNNYGKITKTTLREILAKEG